MDDTPKIEKALNNLILTIEHFQDEYFNINQMEITVEEIEPLAALLIENWIKQLDGKQLANSLLLLRNL